MIGNLITIIAPPYNKVLSLREVHRRLVAASNCLPATSFVW